MQKKVIVRAIGLALSGLLVAMAANAAEQTAAQPTPASVSFQGVQVAIDPSTGRLVAPTAAQRAALSKAMLGSAKMQVAGQAKRPQTEADALKTLKRSSKGRYAASMQVPESMMSSLVAERRADGSVSIHHQDEAAPTAAHAQEAVR